MAGGGGGMGGGMGGMMGGGGDSGGGGDMLSGMMGGGGGGTTKGHPGRVCGTSTGEIAGQVVGTAVGMYFGYPGGGIIGKKLGGMVDPHSCMDPLDKSKVGKQNPPPPGPGGVGVEATDAAREQAPGSPSLTNTTPATIGSEGSTLDAGNPMSREQMMQYLAQNMGDQGWT